MNTSSLPALMLTFLTAFLIAFLAIPVIIRIAQQRHLYDQPNERSAHLVPTPLLGGIGIFGGTFCAIILWSQYGAFGVLHFILAAFMIIFLVGVHDDLMPVSPAGKFLAQLLAAVILVYKSQIRLTSFYGILGLYELPELSAFMLSVLVIVAIVNAFNLIDGINGLSASIALVAGLFWGGWFFLAGQQQLATIAFALCGALTAFLKYNITPARIFMGDSGSLFIGLVCSILAIQFIEQQPLEGHAVRAFHSAPAIAVSVLVFPLFDTLRVFFKRTMAGRSPFSPDKTHIHHLLLDIGFTHRQATFTLVATTILFIALTTSLDFLGNFRLLVLQLALAILLTGLLHRMAAVKISKAA